MTLMSTHIRVKLLKTSAITGGYITRLYNSAKELKRIDGNWYARNTLKKANDKALEAIKEYNQIRDYFNVLELSEISSSVESVENKLEHQSKDSILNIVEHNNLEAKLKDLKSIKRLKEAIPILPEPDELIDYLYAPVTGRKMFEE